MDADNSTSCRFSISNLLGLEESKVDASHTNVALDNNYEKGTTTTAAAAAAATATATATSFSLNTLNYLIL